MEPTIVTTAARDRPLDGAESRDLTSPRALLDGDLGDARDYAAAANANNVMAVTLQTTLIVVLAASFETWASTVEPPERPYTLTLPSSATARWEASSDQGAAPRGLSEIETVLEIGACGDWAVVAAVILGNIAALWIVQAAVTMSLHVERGFASTWSATCALAEEAYGPTGGWRLWNARKVEGRRIRQRRPGGDPPARVRARCRRIEAWIMIYLAMTGRISHHRGDARFRPPATGGDMYENVMTSEGRTDSSDFGMTDGDLVTELPTVTRSSHPWTHASRVGEATHPGPTPATVAAVGLLRRVTEGIRSAVSYPKPGVRTLRGAVAPGYGRVESGPVQQDDEEAFQLRVETTNPTGWRALQRRLLSTTAQVVLAQETWITQDAVPAASAWARKKGWQSTWAAALPGPNGGASGGVAIFAREGIGLHLPPGGSHIWSPGRAVAAVVQAPGHRPVIYVSTYLCHGKGPSGDNLEILAAVGRRLKMAPEGYGFVMGGDFNMEPPEIAATGIQEELSATILAPDTARGTFRGPRSASLLDFYIVSNRLAAAVDSIAVVEASGVKGHVPVALGFKPRVTTLRALHLRRPPIIESERVYGPIPPPPNGDRARKAAEEALRAARRNDPGVQELLDAAYREWADVAEVEMADYASTPPKKWGERGRLPNLVWRSVMPENVPLVQHPHAAAAAWIGTMAREVRRMRNEAGKHDDDDGDHHDEAGDDPDEVPVGDPESVQVERELARARGRKPPTSAAACIRALEELRWSLRHDMPNCGDGDATQEVEALRLRVQVEAELLLHDLGAAGAGECTDGMRAMARSLANAGEENGGPLERLEQLCSDIDTTEAKYTAAEKGEEIRRWREWVSEGIDQGASNAHAYTRLPKAWAPTVAELPDGSASSSVDDLMEEQRLKFKRLWRPVERPYRYDWDDAEELPALNAEQLREAANTFAARTSTTFDGFHPRYIGRLSDGALETLGVIFSAVERCGVWPRQVSLVVAILLPKPAGGFRPIGLAPAVYRLWSKARRATTDEWERRHPRPYFGASAGNGPIDTLWRMAARQEASVASGEVAATISEDLHAFFENIDRDRLLAEAVALGFPLPILRAALAAYSSARMLSMSGRMCREMYPTTGVVAGCSLAMVLTKLYCVRALDGYVQSAPPGTKLDTFVDDFTVSTVGQPQEVLGKLIEAHARLREVVEGLLHCSFAAGKTAITATTRKLAAGLARGIGVAGGVAAVATLLGVDNTAAARRVKLGPSSKKAKRMKAALARKGRLQRLQRVVGSKAKKVFVAGVRPAAAYGAHVWGLDDGEVRKMRRTAAAALRPQARGRSLTLTLLWHDVPTAGAELAPLLQLGRMTWNAIVKREDAMSRGTSISDLRKMWEDASAYFQPLADALRQKTQQAVDDEVPIAFTRQLWKQIRGPLGAAALTAARIGWRFDGPFTIVDQDGADFLLTNTSPALLAKRATEAIKAVMARRIARRWATDEHQYEGRRICMDLITSAVCNNKRLTAHQRGIMRSATCGAIMTGARAIRMGYRTDGYCPLCKSAMDTLAHRIYECPCTASAVAAVVPDWFIKEARRCAATSRFWTTGICPDPGDLAPMPPTTLEVQVQTLVHAADSDPGDLIAIKGRGYVDGSSTTPTIKSLARASCSVVQTTADGTPTKILQAAVPRHLPQTAQAAEYLGMGIAVRALRGETELVGDCLNVVRAVNGWGRQPFSPKKVYAGILLDTQADPQRRRLAGEVRWTRAHRQITGGESWDVVRDIRGNDAADRAAKDALSLHQPSGRLAETQAEYYERRIAHVVAATTTALAMFPRAPGNLQREARPATLSQARKKRLHHWTFRGGAWRCSLCQDWLARGELPRSRRGQRCRGKTVADDAKRMTEKGHCVYRAEAALPFIYCGRCGAWGYRRTRRLSSGCGPPSASGLQALARIRKGLHPLQRRGPRGVLLPRERVCTVGRFCEAAGAWRDMHQRTAEDDGDAHGDGLPGGGEVLQRMQPGAIHGDDSFGGDAAAHGCEDDNMATDEVMIELPPEECAEFNADDHLRERSDEEDVFGHGASLDATTQPAPLDETLRDGPSHVGPQEVHPRPKPACPRRGASSMWEKAASGSAEAATRRLMENSRPAANDGAQRLNEVRRRVRERCRLAEEAAQRGSVASESPGGAFGSRGEARDNETIQEQGSREERDELVARRLRRRIEAEEVSGGQMSGDDGGKEVSDGVLARGVSKYVDIAREGPGDPSPPSVTDAVTRPASAASVAGTVEGGVEVAGPQYKEIARADSNARGKATFGPPRSAAALREDTTSTTGERRGRDDSATSLGKPPFAGGERPPRGREQNSPQETPDRRPAAGAGNSWHGLSDEETAGASRGVERRRDGDVDPLIHAAAARGGGDAAAVDRREEAPLEGARRRARGARNSECRVQDTSDASSIEHHTTIGPEEAHVGSPSSSSISERTPAQEVVEVPSSRKEQQERRRRSTARGGDAPTDPGPQAPSRGFEEQQERGNLAKRRRRLGGNGPRMQMKRSLASVVGGGIEGDAVGRQLSGDGGAAEGSTEMRPSGSDVDGPAVADLVAHGDLLGTASRHPPCHQPEDSAGRPGTARGDPRERRSMQAEGRTPHCLATAGGEASQLRLHPPHGRLHEWDPHIVGPMNRDGRQPHGDPMILSSQSTRVSGDSDSVINHAHAPLAAARHDAARPRAGGGDLGEMDAAAAASRPAASGSGGAAEQWHQIINEGHGQDGTPSEAAVDERQAMATIEGVARQPQSASPEESRTVKRRRLRGKQPTPRDAFAQTTARGRRDGTSSLDPAWNEQRDAEGAGVTRGAQICDDGSMPEDIGGASGTTPSPPLAMTSGSSDPRVASRLRQSGVHFGIATMPGAAGGDATSGGSTRFSALSSTLDRFSTGPPKRVDHELVAVHGASGRPPG